MTMPVHALAGHLVIATAPLAALLALIYAWRPAARRRLRIPFVAAGAVNMALVDWSAGRRRPAPRSWTRSRPREGPRAKNCRQRPWCTPTRRTR
ncbi:hypothetical protein [Streptosporangium sp. H16]|uniref:hypothetical protein n=1 Tax=Streptosporangium sp. H16 TaxID=3444184 RepID=UPI003F78F879